MVIIVRGIYVHLLTNQVIDCQTIGPGLYQFIYNPSTINSQSKCTGVQWLRGSYVNNSEGGGVIPS